MLNLQWGLGQWSLCMLSDYITVPYAEVITYPCSNINADLDLDIPINERRILKLGRL